MSLLFEFKNVQVFQSGNSILKGITFSVAPNEHTAILGPNGSGKTTLMKLMTGDAQAAHKDENSSTSRIFGQSLYSIWDIKRRMGIITNNLQEKCKQDGGYFNGLDTALTGFHDGIGFIRHDKIEKAHIEKAKILMLRLGIEHLMDRPFQFMSSGESRKTLIVRALVSEPDILMLDEPTTGLDIKSQFEFLDFMEKMSDMNHTLLIISHHIEEIIPCIQNVIMLKNGEIFMQGNKEELLTTSNIQKLYEAPITVHKSSNGYYHFTR